jgi:sterol desaturase/sphingolipid hydroxylase (fatty acid hydroxylase superfamily)
MAPVFVVLKSAALLLWAGVIVWLERRTPTPARPRYRDASRHARNLGLWLSTVALSPLLTAPVAAFATQTNLWTRMTLPHDGWMIVADLLLLDLWIYGWHRANHEWPLLWRFHEVHHRDAFLDASSGVRFHPGEVMLSALARAPLIIALDVPLASVLAYDAFVTFAALFHHSNVRIPPRMEAAMRHVIVTPSHHWVHHHAVRADTDSNYGTVLTAWDRLFGSWNVTQRTPEMCIGAENAPELSLVGLLLQPFRRQS